MMAYEECGFAIDKKPARKAAGLLQSLPGRSSEPDGGINALHRRNAALS